MKTLDQMRHERDMRVDAICDSVRAQIERESRWFKGYTDPARLADRFGVQLPKRTKPRSPDRKCRRCGNINPRNETRCKACGKVSHGGGR